MECDTYHALYRPITASDDEDCCTWRRDCGCIRTSDKLKEILKTFPSPPPPFNSPSQTPETDICQTCRYGRNSSTRVSEVSMPADANKLLVAVQKNKPDKFDVRWKKVSNELVQIIQLAVTATALVIYYLIYCYMQLIYFTLQSAMYFHRADGPMKITLGVVALTTVFLLFNITIRLQRLVYEEDNMQVS